MSDKRQPTFAKIMAVTAALILCAAPVAQANVQRPKSQLVFGMTWEPVGFFPIRATDSGSYYAQTLVYEGLLKYSPEIKIVPGLAEQYTISEDGLRYEFRLRKNLHFSDGTSLTLKDVEASFKIATGLDSPFKNDYSDITSFESVGEDKFVVHLSAPNAALLSRLVELRILPSKLTIQPDKGRVVLSRNPVSSGPFCLEKWEAGLELSFKPNPYYWGEQPRVDRLIWRVVPDKTMLALCLSRGEIDVAQVDPQGWKAISGQSQLVLDRFAGSRTLYLALNLTREPFQNLAFREILGKAIDRQAIVQYLFDGLARIPSTDVPSGSWVFDDHLTVCPFDRDKARTELQLFEESTLNKNIGFRIIAVRDHQDIAESIACDLKKIGIRNEVQLVEFSTLRRQYLQPGKFDVVIWSRSCGPDPECGIVWGSRGPLNFCRFKNARVDELLIEGRRAMNREKRAAIYKEVQTILSEQLPWIFLCQPDLLLAHSHNCHNIGVGNQSKTGLPWDNPLFNAASWEYLEGEPR